MLKKGSVPRSRRDNHNIIVWGYIRMLHICWLCYIQHILWLHIFETSLLPNQDSLSKCFSGEHAILFSETHISLSVFWFTSLTSWSFRFPKSHQLHYFWRWGHAGAMFHKKDNCHLFTSIIIMVRTCTCLQVGHQRVQHFSPFSSSPSFPKSLPAPIGALWYLNNVCLYNWTILE